MRVIQHFYFIEINKVAIFPNELDKTEIELNIQFTGSPDSLAQSFELIS